MGNTTLFDKSHGERKRPLLKHVLDRVRPTYTQEELNVLHIDPISRSVLSQRSGRGFVNRDILETVLGNLLECVAPGSHNAADVQGVSDLDAAIEEIGDQLYAMIAQSLLAAGHTSGLETRALETAFAALCDLPRLKERAHWNRFASLKDPAVWDAYIRHRGGLSDEQLAAFDISAQVNAAIAARDIGLYRAFLQKNGLDFALDYQMQLVASTYPGWRVLLYHDIAQLLTRSGPCPRLPSVRLTPAPFLPRAISELGARYYQADLHPETQVGDANFLEHPHRGLTTGQTGVIGSGCVIYPCTLGGLTDKVKQRHPIIGDYVVIGTDAGIFGPVHIHDRSIIGANTEIYGLVEVAADCRIGTSAIIGTIRSGAGTPGKIHLGQGVRVGDGAIIESSTELDLVIPDKAVIPARSNVVNDGFGRPRIVQS